MSFRDKLSSIEDSKNKIKDKLIEYEVENVGDVLSTYPNKIRQIKNELMEDGEIRLPNYSSQYKSIYYNGYNTFVAISSASSKIFYSKNATSWNTATLPINITLSAIASNPSYFVAISYNSNKAVYSSDGINWTATTLPINIYCRSICSPYNGYRCVAVGNSSYAVYSDDCINWVQTTMPFSADWQSVCSGIMGYVAVAKDTDKAAYSGDGITWTEITLPASTGWKAVCSYYNTYIAIADNTNNASCSAAISYDGINWTELVISSNSSAKRLWSICHDDNGNFCVFNINGSPYFSFDGGENWSARNATWQPFPMCCYGDGKFVVIEGGDNSPKLKYTTDNINWKETAPQSLYSTSSTNPSQYIHKSVTNELIPSSLTQSVKGYTKNWVGNVDIGIASTLTTLTKDDFTVYCYDGILYIIAKAPANKYFRTNLDYARPRLYAASDITLLGYTPYAGAYNNSRAIYMYSVPKNRMVDVSIYAKQGTSTSYIDLAFSINC